jgi:hypothetical protein
VLHHPACGHASSFPVRSPPLPEKSVLTFFLACAGPCLSNAFFGSCQPNDYGCLCRSNAYINSVSSCFVNACSGVELQDAVSGALNLCAAVVRVVLLCQLIYAYRRVCHRASHSLILCRPLLRPVTQLAALRESQPPQF